MRLTLTRCIPVLLLLAVASALAATGSSSDQPRCRATLIAENDAIQPGKPFTLALLLQAEPHWHTYWRNPGETGLATKLQWTLPEGFTAGDIQWPTPRKFVTDGPIINFGYEGEVLLLVDITPPENLTTDTVTLAAKASWLVCDPGSCIPGRANLSIDLPVTQSEPAKDAAWSDRFTAAREGMPQPIEPDRVGVQQVGANVVATIAYGEKAAEHQLTFFPADRNAFESIAQLHAQQAGVVDVTLSLLDPNNPPKRVRGVLTTPLHAYLIDVPIPASE